MKYDEEVYEHLARVSLPKEALKLADELEEIVSQTLMSGIDRDAFSGWGGVVYTL